LGQASFCQYDGCYAGKTCSIPGVECEEFQSITLKIAPSVGRSCFMG